MTTEVAPMATPTRLRSDRAREGAQAALLALAQAVQRATDLDAAMVADSEPAQWDALRPQLNATLGSLSALFTRFGQYCWEQTLCFYQAIDGDDGAPMGVRRADLDEIFTRLNWAKSFCERLVRDLEQQVSIAGRLMGLYVRVFCGLDRDDPRLAQFETAAFEPIDAFRARVQAMFQRDNFDALFPEVGLPKVRSFRGTLTRGWPHATGTSRCCAMHSMT
jgi:hypothetical protein